MVTEIGVPGGTFGELTDPLPELTVNLRPFTGYPVD